MLKSIFWSCFQFHGRFGLSVFKHVFVIQTRLFPKMVFRLGVLTIGLQIPEVVPRTRRYKLFLWIFLWLFLAYSYEGRPTLRVTSYSGMPRPRSSSYSYGYS